MARLVFNGKPSMNPLTHRLTRLLRMKDTIADNPGIRRSDLVQQFNISERTIQDDIAILKAAGVPVIRKCKAYEIDCKDGSIL
jgi:predicted DNA-binding transcriptional regulator YafY